jgi:hypothetical protein
MIISSSSRCWQVNRQQLLQKLLKERTDDTEVGTRTKAKAQHNELRFEDKENHVEQQMGCRRRFENGV